MSRQRFKTTSSLPWAYLLGFAFIVTLITIVVLPADMVGQCGNPVPCAFRSLDGTSNQVFCNCDPGLSPQDCSPIIIDTQGDGFHLTSAIAGVMFDITGTGHPVEIAWTDAHFRNAFLALPGPDGLVHNGKELFGNFTPQPKSDHPNGFIALAQYDSPENGGNGDGVIDARDAVFSRLRLWIDENHDGICQPGELHRLQELGVFSISLKYRESRRVDRYGNEFRYRGRINVTGQAENESEADPVIYDVFLVTGGS